MGRGKNTTNITPHLRRISKADLRSGNPSFLNGPELNDDKPLLLLDIDGVLSPLNPKNPENYTQIEAQYLMDFHSQLPEYMKTLIKHTAPVWATTWEASANENTNLLNHLGLSKLPWINFRSPLAIDYSEDKGEEFKTRKLQAVKTLAEAYPKRQIIWCEDDIEEDALRWIEERNKTVKTLLINPKKNIGLTPPDFQKINDFLGL